jgi:hypothetical protein
MTVNASGRRLCADGGTLPVARCPANEFDIPISDKFYGDCSVQLSRRLAPSALTPRLDKRIAAPTETRQ